MEETNGVGSRERGRNEGKVKQWRKTGSRAGGGEVMREGMDWQWWRMKVMAEGGKGKLEGVAQQ